MVDILPGMTTFGPRDDIWLSDVMILSHGAIISSKSSIYFEMLINLNFFTQSAGCLSIRPRPTQKAI